MLRDLAELDQAARMSGPDVVRAFLAGAARLVDHAHRNARVYGLPYRTLDRLDAIASELELAVEELERPALPPPAPRPSGRNRYPVD